MQGNYISKLKGYYVLNYFGKNTECGQFGEIYISTSKDNKQLQFYLGSAEKAYCFDFKQLKVIFV